MSRKSFYVSFAEYSLFYRALLQKRPIISRSLHLPAAKCTVGNHGRSTKVCCATFEVQLTAARKTFAPKSFDLSSLQHTAKHCNTLQHTATPCNTLQHTATHCNTLQHTATPCNTLQHFRLVKSATHCNTLQHTATHCNTFTLLLESLSTCLFASTQPRRVAATTCCGACCVCSRVFRLVKSFQKITVERLSRHLPAMGWLRLVGAFKL